MKVFSGSRRSGKTTQIIEAADNKNGYIVCMNLDEAQRVFRLARDMGKSINMPITFSEFLDGHYHGLGCQKFHIDNAELLLSRISSIPVESCSFTTD